MALCIFCMLLLNVLKLSFEKMGTEEALTCAVWCQVGWGVMIIFTIILGVISLIIIGYHIDTTYGKNAGYKRGPIAHAPAFGIRYYRQTTNMNLVFCILAAIGMAIVLDLFTVVKLLIDGVWLLAHIHLKK